MNTNLMAIGRVGRLDKIRAWHDYQSALNKLFSIALARTNPNFLRCLLQPTSWYYRTHFDTGNKFPAKDKASVSVSSDVTSFFCPNTMMCASCSVSGVDIFTTKMSLQTKLVVRSRSKAYRSAFFGLLQFYGRSSLCFN